MIVEFENESMSYLIFLVHVSVETDDPNVKYKDSYPSPGWEVPGERTVFRQCKIINLNNHNQQYEKGDTDPNPKPQKTGVQGSRLCFLCSSP